MEIRDRQRRARRRLNLPTRRTVRDKTDEPSTGPGVPPQRSIEDEYLAAFSQIGLIRLEILAAKTEVMTTALFKAGKIFGAKEL